MSKSIVIIGGSQSHVPLILAARRLGYKTIVFDQNPIAPGAILANKFFAISTHDIEKIYSTLLLRPLSSPEFLRSPAQE